MTATVKELRSAVRTALEGDAYFADFAFDDWGRNGDDKRLPKIGIFTPRRTPRTVGVGKRQETVDLTVAVKRSGGEDLEDELDDDAAKIDEIVTPVLNALADDADLSSVENDVPGIGDTRIATCLVTFRVELLTARPT